MNQHPYTNDRPTPGGEWPLDGESPNFEFMPPPAGAPTDSPTGPQLPGVPALPNGWAATEASIPVLPTLPVAPPAAVSAPPVTESLALEKVLDSSFDAAAMVEATRAKAIDPPAYGGMPKATAESMARAEALRVEARRQRRRNQRVFRLIVAAILLALVAAGAAMVFLFQSDSSESGQEARPAASLDVTQRT